jgi:hypothetical protein
MILSPVMKHDLRAMLTRAQTHGNRIEPTGAIVGRIAADASPSRAGLRSRGEAIPD